MKLLFDENLSHRLVRMLADLFPDSVHVREVGLEAADDPVVWDYAKNNDLMIVSKDSDLHQRSFVFGHPPKIIWVRLGNCSTSDVER
jgi:predicted nuclease of predicted toxin-antitoxin system